MPLRGGDKFSANGPPEPGLGSRLYVIPLDAVGQGFRTTLCFYDTPLPLDGFYCGTVSWLREKYVRYSPLSNVLLGLPTQSRTLCDSVIKTGALRREEQWLAGAWKKSKSVLGGTLSTHEAWAVSRLQGAPLLTARSDPCCSLLPHRLTSVLRVVG